MGYQMIENIGNLLVELLCREMVPEVIMHDSSIGLCSPDDHGDFKLGIYLYDICENEDIRASGMINAGTKKQLYPPVYLSLCYMITAYSDSDIKFRAQEEHKILGRVVQVLRDNSVLPKEILGGGASMPAQIQIQSMQQYEKMHMWNFSGEPYRLSLFYRIQPVEISSAKTREIVRVRDADFTMPEDKEAMNKKNLHVSLAVLVLDSFTGEPAASGSVTVSIPGHKPAVVKSDGYHVFVNLTESKADILCESRIYECRTEQVSLSGEEEEVFIIRLMPNARYPFPKDTTCVSGHTQANRRLMFWKGNGEGYRLLHDYQCIEQEEGHMLAIYNPNNKELAGKKFFICDKEKKEKEYFQISGRTGEYYQIDRALHKDYKKIGTAIVPVYEICADETGEFFLPVEKNSKKEIELICQAEGDKEEKRFLLLPGKANTITL